MKKITLLCIVIAITTSSFIISDIANKTDIQETSTLEKIANAHGFQNWDNVSEIKFTFNVDRDTTHFERSWIWETDHNDITAITADKTLRYNWSNMDSTAYKTNGSFINDKYWLLTPYQLIWDSDNISHTHHVSSTAPISKKTMQKLTIVYGSEGGYTPGDAYDFYFGDDYIIKEWVFRKGNQPQPSMTTTFEDYREISGLKIPTMHKNAEGSFKLYFTGLDVKTK
ncbi:hypothetical protein [Costertonia aggregata]|uniref:Uncharacterized protein n=1 Tax=Costertonia aggregata TaxID=343403 RepID=A0A7H9ALJ2_9FLAO|nr:hypothetical protein [Costertonia aggregata]QLG44311.1 hypothetical protein HYG79_02780 [Costertonia aggregata]